MNLRCISLILIAASAGAAVGSPAVDYSVAEGLYRQTEYAGAIEALRAVPAGNAAADALLGKAYYMEGRYKEAVTSLEKAVAEEPLNSDYYDWLGKAYGRLAEGSSFLSALGNARKTVRAFEKAVVLDPSNLEALSDVFEYYLQAPGIVGGGLDKAEDISRRFATVNAAEYHWSRARLAEKRKDFDAAEREYRVAWQTEPNQVGRALDLAAFLSSRGKLAESDAIFRTAAESHPDAPKVLYARAAAYIQGKRNLDEAQALLRRYLHSQTTPDDPSRQEAAALLRSARELRAKSRDAD